MGPLFWPSLKPPGVWGSAPGAGPGPPGVSPEPCQVPKGKRHCQYHFPDEEAEVQSYSGAELRLILGLDWPPQRTDTAAGQPWTGARAPRLGRAPGLGAHVPHPQGLLPAQTTGLTTCLRVGRAGTCPWPRPTWDAGGAEWACGLTWAMVRPQQRGPQFLLQDSLLGCDKHTGLRAFPG